MAELRYVAEFCNFGASLEDMLRDQIVYGINEDGIQQKCLLKNSHLPESFGAIPT